VVLTNGSTLPETRRREEVGADGVWSGPEKRKEVAGGSVGGVSFRGGEKAAASGSGGGISGGGFGASRRRWPCAAGNKDTRGVGCLSSTPTRRVLECFVGPFPDKTGPPNIPRVFYRVVIGPGFYTSKPAQTREETLAPNEA
jgi:hypothetical protein